MTAGESLALQNELVSPRPSQVTERMKVSASLQCFIAALILTLAQIGIAVCVVAPPAWPLSDRYASLIQHDGYWFANIVNRGYGTTVPPMDHKVMEVSNVAFFPAYPVLVHAASVRFAISMPRARCSSPRNSPLWVSGFISFSFANVGACRRCFRFFGAVAIVAHPAAFFLIAGYSESLFLMSLVGFIYWSSAEGRAAKILAALHGFVMSATRIVGIPCALFPIVRAVFENGWNGLRECASAGSGDTVRRSHYSCAAMLGAIAFFVYCQLRWGRWDMYMLTQEAEWAIKPDYFAFFKPASYRWLFPPLNNPTLASQLTTVASRS